MLRYLARPGKTRAWSDSSTYPLCFMNRFVEGLGLTPIPDQFEMEGKMIEDGGHAGMLDAFGVK